MFKTKNIYCDQMWDDGYDGSGGFEQNFSERVKTAYQDFKDCFDKDSQMEIMLTHRVGVSNWQHDELISEFDKKRKSWKVSPPYPGVEFSFDKKNVYYDFRIVAKNLITTISGNRSAVKNSLIQMGEHTSQSFENAYPDQLTVNNHQKKQVITKKFEDSFKNDSFERFFSKVNSIQNEIHDVKIKTEIKIGPNSKRVKLFSQLDFPYEVSVEIEAPALMLRTLNIMLGLDE